MTTRDNLDDASKRHPFGDASILAAGRDDIDRLQAENAVMREALERIEVAAQFYSQPGTDGMASRYAHESHCRLAHEALNKAGPVVLVTSDVVKTVAKEAREKALEDAAIRAESHGFERGKPMRKTYARASAEAGKMIAASIRAMKEHTDE